ncbi:MAG: hypothetical protein RLZZ268_1143 [Cyanobacteriota bacterium]|jgi:hypothetical protein
MWGSNTPIKGPLAVVLPALEPLRAPGVLRHKGARSRPTDLFWTRSISGQQLRRQPKSSTGHPQLRRAARLLRRAAVASDTVACNGGDPGVMFLDCLRRGDPSEQAYDRRRREPTVL